MKKIIAGIFNAIHVIRIINIDGNLPIKIKTNFATYVQKSRSHIITANTKYIY